MDEIENKLQNLTIDKKLQSTGLQRNQIDKFYTNPSIVKLCFKYIKKYIKIDDSDIIIEPSAGNGSFIKYIKKITSNYRFYDIEPEHPDIIKQDFLLLNVKDNDVHIIGNPPFGRQSSLAIKFIKKCCEFSKTISFILPRSFKKDSLKKHFSLNYHLIYEMDLPENSFLINNKETDVPCIFQIWERQLELRNIPKKLIPNGYKFVKKNEEPDIAFRRVGVNAGKISLNILDKSIQSHYFIIFENKNVIKKLYDIEFECNNTVGPKSISKQELIKIYNQLTIDKKKCKKI
jgi:hypothetical protein